jgi:hypothetical protein
MKKYIIFMHTLISFSISIMAQTNTGYMQYSIKHGINLSSTQTYTLPPIDAGTVAAQDKAEEGMNIPPRFAIENDVNITTENSGKWQTLPNGDKLWLLIISGPGAKSLHFYYDKFYIPAGASFSIYDESRSEILGAFTSRDNRGTASQPGDFITGLIFNEKAVLEYYQPASVTNDPVISISKAMYGYRGINVMVGNRTKSVGFGGSGSCEVNINCSPTGDPWQSEKTGVAMTVYPLGRVATGTLINDVPGDGKPYFLTANHTLQPGGSGTTLWDAVSNPDMPNWLFYWNYEYTGSNPCTSDGTDFVPQYTTGATVVANDVCGTSSDFALLLLTQSPYSLTPPVDAFYSGWDNTGTTPTGGACIHHPMGDIKKITIPDYTTSIVVGGCGGGNIGSGFWNVTVFYNTGIGSVEPGSSGSALFDQNHHIIGQLWGHGTANFGCTGPVDAVYGQFSFAWTNNGATDSRRSLKPWLDPGNTGATTLNGGTLQVCSPTSIAITSPVTTSGTQQAGSTITASSAISSGLTVNYIAGSSITLQPGFSTGPGFTASIQPCYKVSRKLNASSAEPSAMASPVSASFIVYPNPTSGKLSVSLSIDRPETATLELFDMQGRHIEKFWTDKEMESGIYQGDITFDTGIADGVYILRVSGKYLNQSIRVTKSSY